MKLYIPQVGDKLIIEENWNVKIFNEGRNASVFEAFGLESKHDDIDGTEIDLTLPKGTVLKIDRLYIRKPASDFDSITFTIESSPLKKLAKARFWVKIKETSNLECSQIIINKADFKKTTELFKWSATQLGVINSSTASFKQRNAIVNFLAKEYENIDSIHFKAQISTHYIVNLLQKFDHYFEGQEYEERQVFYKKIQDKTEVNLSIIPVLDGFLIKSNLLETLQDAFAMYVEAMTLYNKNWLESKNCPNIPFVLLLGDDNWLLKDKKCLEVERFNFSFENALLEYNGKSIEVPTYHDFNKAIKKIVK